MKKYIMVTMGALLLLCGAAMAQATNPIRMNNPNALSIDTVNNTTVEGPTITVSGSCKTVSFVIKFTKISGTVAGTVQLYGANKPGAVAADYAAVGSSKTNTDVASQTWVFDDTPKRYAFYKLVITPTGTMSASYEAFEYYTK